MGEKSVTRQPLVRWTDKELIAALDTDSEHVTYYYNDYVRDISLSAPARSSGGAVGVQMWCRSRDSNPDALAGSGF